MTLLPFIGTSGELKTKPTQHSVQKLREIGIQPDVLLCRTEKKLSKSMKESIVFSIMLKNDAMDQGYLLLPDYDNLSKLDLTNNDYKLKLEYINQVLSSLVLSN